MLVATTMQVSSAKDKNSVISDLSFNGMIEEIWEVSYNSFIIATYGKQVFYVKDSVDARWSIVVMQPQKDFPYKCSNDDLRDMLLHYPQVSKWNITSDIDESGDRYTRPNCEGT
ncbi:transposase [Cucumis melo var. makuwa]|uniref:Transposase n=1 Tax=Cucumis melo var. makuwa TaxID=1194695 RepID=A0A5D3C3K1_CUCMM|nr:transposase [Cucumis melo var. makuwa]